MAIRIQRKRTKDYSQPLGTIYVGRPTRWGNPFKITKQVTQEKSVEMYKECILNNAMAYAYCNLYDDDVWGSDVYKHFQWISENIHILRGANLSCWCPLDKPCHADILLKYANADAR